MTASTSDTSTKEQALGILNIQYAVFLGVIVTFSFCFTNNALVPVVEPLKRPEAVLFTIYFLFDWFTANMVEVKSIPTPAGLLARVAWIVVTGITVLSLNGNGVWKFQLLSVYTIISGVYDVFFMRSIARSHDSPDTVRGLILAFERLTVAGVIAVPTVIGMMGRVDVLLLWDNPNTYKDALFMVVLLYVLLKIGRFEYLARRAYHD